MRSGGVLACLVGREAVSDRGGRRRSRRRVPKMSLDQLGLFARAGAPRLVLVTCGGAFDPARHSYEDNVVVQARPA